MTVVVSTLYPISDGPQGLEKALKAVCAEAERKVRAAISPPHT